MQLDYLKLWTSFRTSLINSINETEINDFEKAWVSRTERTLCYFDSLLPKIAGKMNLEFEKEMYFRVDGTFYKTGGQKIKVPIIFLESENDVRSSDGEVKKLCLLNAPLKVLMICNDWNDSSKKIITEGYWDYIIDDFKDENCLTGYFAFIIAEWNDTLKFYSYVYNEKAEIIEDKLMIEI